jgi:DNA polymerase-3 subunit alpha
MDDAKTYALLCRGNSLGVFQLESDGMRDLLMRMKPEQFSDLIALVALYRPGPLNSGMVDTFVDTKHGHRQPDYPLPQIKEVLKETYGVIVYQEQVMKISNILAGYSLGDADILRRAMGKKIPEVMEKERGKFMAGAKANNIPEDKAKYIFDLMAKFAGYGFNKSHSAAYALIAYQTAYLKAHYPAQFLAALLSCDVENTDKVVKYINECRQEQIEVLPPDINESFNDFTVINDRIRFGLAAVKHVGGAALEAILVERTSNGPFRSLSEFCGRIDSSKVNRKVIESLIKAGAFDSMAGRRAQYMEILDQCIDRAKAVQRDRLSGQMSLFGVGQSASAQEDATEVELPDIPEWPKLQRLAGEKETVGFFLTGHPLEGVQNDLRWVTDTDIAGAGQLRDGQTVRIGGLIANCKEHKSKKGDRMAFTVLEDMNASVEVIVFPSTFAGCSHLLTSEQPLVVTGTVQQSERFAKGGEGVEERAHDEEGKQQEQLRPKVIAQEVRTLDEALEQYAERAVITLAAGSTSRQHMMDLKEELYRFHGATPVLLTFHFDNRGQVDIQVMKDMGVRACPEFIRTVGRICGPRALSLQMKKPEVPVRRGNGNGRNGHASH